MFSKDKMFMDDAIFNTCQTLLTRLLLVPPHQILRGGRSPEASRDEDLVCGALTSDADGGVACTRWRHSAPLR